MNIDKNGNEYEPEPDEETDDEAIRAFLADQDCDARECALFAGEFDENYLFLGD